MICNFRAISEKKNFMHLAASQKTIFISVLVFGCTFKLFCYKSWLWKEIIWLLYCLYFNTCTTCHTNCLYLVKSSTTGRQAQGRVFEWSRENACNIRGDNYCCQILSTGCRGCLKQRQEPTVHLWDRGPGNDAVSQPQWPGVSPDQ